jgi:hypothetical protein
LSYKADASLADLFPADFVEVVGRDIVENVQSALLDSAEHRTPIAQIPQAYDGDFEAWEEDRGGRLPGTLRDSWVELPIKEKEGTLSAPVENVDPIASHVEHDTSPHMIFAKPGGVLRFPSGPVFRYRPNVWHPGTEGKHMLRDAEADISARWPAIGQRVIDLHEAGR